MEAGNKMVTCGSWIRRPKNVNLVVLGKSKKRNSSSSSSPSMLEIFSFDPNSTSLSPSLWLLMCWKKLKGIQHQLLFILTEMILYVPQPRVQAILPHKRIDYGRAIQIVEQRCFGSEEGMLKNN